MKASSEFMEPVSVQNATLQDYVNDFLKEPTILKGIWAKTLCKKRDWTVKYESNALDPHFNSYLDRLIF